MTNSLARNRIQIFMGTRTPTCCQTNSHPEHIVISVCLASASCCQFRISGFPPVRLDYKLISEWFLSTVAKTPWFQRFIIPLLFLALCLIVLCMIPGVLGEAHASAVQSEMFVLAIILLMGLLIKKLEESGWPRFF